jgi:cell division protein FtsL
MKSETTWGQIYANRAQQPEPVPEKGIVVPRIREARDMVYNGTMPAPEPEAKVIPMPGVTRNRRTTKRKFSPFNMILLLLSIAIVSVLYISNILAVGRLVRQINILEQTHQRLVNEQELLRAQINRLSSLERINQDVAVQFGLGTPTTPPVWLNIDRARVQELEDALVKSQQR